MTLLAIVAIHTAANEPPKVRQVMNTIHRNVAAHSSQRPSQLPSQLCSQQLRSQLHSEAAYQKSRADLVDAGNRYAVRRRVSLRRVVLKEKRSFSAVSVQLDLCLCSWLCS